MTKTYEITCSFCGKERLEVDKLVTGPAGVAICNECAELGFALTVEKPGPSAQAVWLEAMIARTRQEPDRASAVPIADFADAITKRFEGNSWK